MKKENGGKQTCEELELPGILHCLLWLDFGMQGVHYNIRPGRQSCKGSNAVLRTLALSENQKSY